MPGKIGKAWFIHKKWQFISTVCKLFKHNFCWNLSEFNDKMDLTIQMTIFDKVKHCHAICLKFGDRFFTSLTLELHLVKLHACNF